MNSKELIYEGIETALINFNYKSNINYRLQFIDNNYKEGRKVLSNIETELLDCQAFHFRKTKYKRKDFNQ